MKHRIGGLENVTMGLGADNIPYELDNSWSNNIKLNEVADKMFNEALEVLFKPNNVSGFDYKVECKGNIFKITFGFEPAYKHDPYLMYCIASDYKSSFMKKGEAKGFYGTKIKLDNNKKIIDQDCDKAFIDFVDKWYTLLYETLPKDNVMYLG